MYQKLQHYKLFKLTNLYTMINIVYYISINNDYSFNYYKQIICHQLMTLIDSNILSDSYLHVLLYSDDVSNDIFLSIEKILLLYLIDYKYNVSNIYNVKNISKYKLGLDKLHDICCNDPDNIYIYLHCYDIINNDKLYCDYDSSDLSDELTKKILKNWIKIHEMIKKNDIKIASPNIKQKKYDDYVFFWIDGNYFLKNYSLTSNNNFADMFFYKNLHKIQYIF